MEKYYIVKYLREIFPYNIFKEIIDKNNEELNYYCKSLDTTIIFNKNETEESIKNKIKQHDYDLKKTNSFKSTNQIINDNTPYTPQQYELLICKCGTMTPDCNREWFEDHVKKCKL